MGKRARQTLSSEQIGEIIRRGPTELAPALAQEFGVSVRTITRLRSLYPDPSCVPRDDVEGSGAGGGSLPLRKRQVNLNYKTRRRIIERLNAGESVEYLAKEHGVSSRTVHELGRFQESCLAKIDGARRNPRSLELKRLSELPLHKAVMDWYEKRLVELGTDRLPNMIIQQRALELNHEMGGPPTFKASNGWLWSFKKHYGLLLGANQDDPLASSYSPSESSEEDAAKSDGNTDTEQKCGVFITVKEQPYAEEPAENVDPAEAYRAATTLTKFMESRMPEDVDNLRLVQELRDRIFAIVSST